MLEPSMVAPLALLMIVIIAQVSRTRAPCHRHWGTDAGITARSLEPSCIPPKEDDRDRGYAAFNADNQPDRIPGRP
jgi:hypothetical protein